MFVRHYGHFYGQNLHRALQPASTSVPLAHAAASALPQCLTSTHKQRLRDCLLIAASAIAILPDRCSGSVLGQLNADVLLLPLQMFVNRAAHLLAESSEEWEASQPSWQETEVGCC